MLKDKGRMYLDQKLIQIFKKINSFGSGKLLQNLL